MSDTAEQRVKILRQLNALRQEWYALGRTGRSMLDDLATLDEIDDWIERQTWECWRVVPSADDIMTQVIDMGREPLDDPRHRERYWEWQQERVSDMLWDMEIPRVPLDQEEES